MRCVGTNLIHDFTAVIFSVKLAVFRETLISVKFREIYDFSAFTFIYESFQSIIIQYANVSAPQRQRPSASNFTDQVIIAKNSKLGSSP